MIMKKVKSIHQLPADNRRLKSVAPNCPNATQRIFRPAQKVSDLIKRGLTDGIMRHSDLGDALYDDSEGRAPLATHIDADMFEVATTMMRNGDSAKNISNALLKISND